MELVPIITTVLSYGIMILSLVVIVSYSISKYKSTAAAAKLVPVEDETAAKQIIRQKMNEAQVRIIADKEIIKKGNISYLSQKTEKVSAADRKVTVLNNKRPTRYEIINERQPGPAMNNIYSYSGNF